jgi:hypothetical protein
MFDMKLWPATRESANDVRMIWPPLRHVNHRSLAIDCPHLVKPGVDYIYLSLDFFVVWAVTFFGLGVPDFADP